MRRPLTPACHEVSAPDLLQTCARPALDLLQTCSRPALDLPQCSRPARLQHPSLPQTGSSRWP
eukprot:248372-Hanusia_phi.AAC.1